VLKLEQFKPLNLPVPQATHTICKVVGLQVVTSHHTRLSLEVSKDWKHLTNVEFPLIAVDGRLSRINMLGNLQQRTQSKLLFSKKVFRIQFDIKNFT
jgi:hypothetical protein